MHADAATLAHEGVAREGGREGEARGGDVRLGRGGGLRDVRVDSPVCKRMIVAGNVVQALRQRIDLLGVKKEDLVGVWKDIGMPSGHAYAKALRTVKSCVGSTWCRYGVQDSVKMAIDVENRYRGLRSPHKLKRW